MTCESCLDIFPIILYTLSIVLIIALIFLVVRLIKTLKKVDQTIEDVNEKVNKLNGVFELVDNAADAVSLVSDKFVNLLSNGIVNLFKKRKRKVKKEEDYE